MSSEQRAHLWVSESTPPPLVTTADTVEVFRGLGGGVVGVVLGGRAS